MDKEFNEIIQAVADATGMQPKQFLRRTRFQEAMDARWVVVLMMRDEGFYTSRIADYLSMTTRNVNHILLSISLRLDRGDCKIGHILDKARKHLGNSRETSSRNG